MFGSFSYLIAFLFYVDHSPPRAKFSSGEKAPRVKA